MVNSNEQFVSKFQRTTKIFFGLVIGLYGISSFFPDSFLWGVNHLAFVSPATRIIIVGIAIGLGAPGISKRYLEGLVQLLESLSVTKVGMFIVLLMSSAVGAVLLYHFRIITDMYGDSRTLLAFLSEKTCSLADLFNVKDTEPLTRYVHQAAANVFHIDQKSAYQILGSLAGGIVLFFFLRFLTELDGSVWWKVFLVVLGLSCGANQLFFGHVEDYTLAYACAILFLISAWRSFDNEKTLTTMIILFIIGLRLHVLVILFAPALVYAILYHRRKFSPRYERWLKPRNISLAVFVSMIVALAAYFFYFHADKYFVNDRTEQVEKIFLPIVSPLPLPHYYTLLSLSHLSDVVQEFLLTVSPSAILILWMSAHWRHRSVWQQPRIMFFALAAFYFLVFNLAVNPTLTMERDWDLLSLAAAPVFFLAIALSQHLFEKKLSSSEWTTITGVGLAAGLLSCTFFYVNTSESSMSRRLEGIGKWAFKSYYLGSSYLINVGEKMIADSDERIVRTEKTIQELSANASVPDMELANLYHTMGSFLFARKQFEGAARYYGKALENDSSSATATKAFVKIALQLRQFDEASRIISFYNESANHPNVIDFSGLVLAQRCNYFQYLKSIGTDSIAIQKQLDDLYETWN